MIIEEAKNRIIAAFDVPDFDAALQLTRQVRRYVRMAKVGMELFTAIGPTGVLNILLEGMSVFLDLKFKDIPNTVAGAARSATNLAVQMFNVHCDGGLEMMQAAKSASVEAAGKVRLTAPLVLGVTVLTSVDKLIMNEQLRIAGEVQDQVIHLAKLARAAGLDGVIASSQEVRAIREACGDNFVIVAPGVRLSDKVDDQKRTGTPGKAIADGANFVVVGRPIYQYPPEQGGPVEGARLIAEDIANFAY